MNSTSQAAKHLAMAAALLFTTATVAQAAIADIKTMKNGAPVNIAGTVDRVDSARTFVLRDETGKITIDIESDQSVVLSKDMYVTVGGTVDSGIFGTDINAATVKPHKSLRDALADIVKPTTGLNIAGARATTIANLPDEGLVKLQGIVLKVQNEKEFTLQDGSGTVNIDIQSDKYAVLSKGTQVIVVGYVDSSAFSKDINATDVSVVAEAAAGTTAER